MDDLISRQAAIDVINKEQKELDVSDVPALYAYSKCKTIIKLLPSAEPQIIRCKDCKHWIPYDWMFSEVWQSRNIDDYPEDEIGCDCCDMSMKANDFCSRAERRTE